MYLTYAVVTPLRKRTDGTYVFKVRPPHWSTDPWITHTYATLDLARLGRHGWISYYRGKHIEVRTRL